MSMAKVSAVYGGFLNAETVRDAGLEGEKLLILSAEDYKFDDGSKKIVLEFDEGYRLALNVTNANILAKAFGDETEDWENETIKLAVEKVKFGKKTVDGVRVKPIGGKAEVQEVK